MAAQALCDRHRDRWRSARRDCDRASYDRKIAAIFVAAAAASFVVLRLVAAGVMALARLVPRLALDDLRLASATSTAPGR